MSDKKDSRRGLGRGLSALMADVDLAPNTPRTAERTVPIERVEPNPDQPRRHFEQDDLTDLAIRFEPRGSCSP